MRVSKPFILHLPTCLVNDIREYLKTHPPNFRHNEVYFFYLFYYITFRMLTTKENEVFIVINMKNLQSAIVSNIRSYVKYLENGYFLTTNKFYKKGETSKGYQIPEKYLKVDSITTIEILPKTNLYKKIMKQITNRKAHFSRMNPHLQEMKKLFFSIEFDYDAAFKYIIENKHNFKNALIHLTALQSMKDKRLRYFHISKSNGRLNTNLTSFWKELRQFIKGNYYSIDLKNSQPFFLSVILNTITKNKNIHTGIMYDILGENIVETFGKIAMRRISKFNQKSKKSNLVNLSLFIKKTTAGKFYEYLKETIKDKSREEIKKIAFEIYYSKNEHYKENKELFRKVFPYILKVIEILKQKDHTTLSIFMQKIESYIFIECIAKKLVEADIIPLTIHDSVIVKKEQVQEAMVIMNDVFIEQFGIIPTFEIEKIKI